MIIRPTPFEGFFVIEPELKQDDRGFFLEVYRQDVFDRHNIPTHFVQKNHTRSKKGVLRGLHFQWEPMLGKLIRVVQGGAYMVAVDIRTDSPTFGKWIDQELTAENKIQMYAPPGFATGFCVTGDVAEVEYHYTALYNQKGESNIHWKDPELAIPWPIENPILSERDQNAQTLKEWLVRPESKLF